MVALSRRGSTGRLRRSMVCMRTTGGNLRAATYLCDHIGQLPVPKFLEQDDGLRPGWADASTESRYELFWAAAQDPRRVALFCSERRLPIDKFPRNDQTSKSKKLMSEWQLSASLLSNRGNGGNGHDITSKAVYVAHGTNQYNLAP